MASEPFKEIPIGIRKGHLAALSGNSIKVYVALLTHRNHKTGRCNPKVQTLMTECGIKKSHTVHAALDALRDCGLVAWRKTGGPNRYFLGDITISGQIVPAVVPLNGTTDVPVMGTTDMPITGTTDVPVMGTQKDHYGKDHKEPPPQKGAVAPEGGGRSEREQAEALDDEAEDSRSPSARKNKGAAGHTHDAADGLGDSLAARKGPRAEYTGPQDEMAAGQVTDAPAAPTPSPGRQLTDADRDAIRASPTTMGLWLVYGKKSIGRSPEQCAAELKPTTTNWFHGAPDRGSMRPDATKAQLAGAAWWLLSHLRHNADLPLLMPGRHDLVGNAKGPQRGILGDLFEKRGAAATWEYLQAAYLNAEDILADENLKGLNSPPAFDAGYFRHGAVIKKVDRLMNQQEAKSQYEENEMEMYV